MCGLCSQCGRDISFPEVVTAVAGWYTSGRGDRGVAVVLSNDSLRYLCLNSLRTCGE